MKRPKSNQGAEALLQRVTRAARDDDEQLRALATAIAEEVALPADAFVVGEPINVVTVGYEGNPRSGLRATCRRGDDSYTISFGDVVLAPGTPGARWSAAYRMWLGLVPHGEGPESSAGPTRRHKAEAGDIVISRPLDLIVLAVKSNALRCRVPGTEREITLRTPVRFEIPGEIVTVIPRKQWTHAGHPYLSGTVQQSRLDAGALGLVPLALRPEGAWDPDEEQWGEEGEPPPDWARPIIARGKRPAFEMEQVIPGADPDDWDTDPIIEANELRAAGDPAAANDLLMSLLARDLRCLDAHAHLGNAEFKSWPQQALRHYLAGVGIGELTLGRDFDGVLPWGLVDNRPFLRCLNGMALCLWRTGKPEEAMAAFKRLLWLNPSNNQGARFCAAAIAAGRPWEELGDQG